MGGGSLPSMSLPGAMGVAASHNSLHSAGCSSQEQEQETPSSDQYVSADYSPQDVPEAERIDVVSSSGSDT